MHVTSDSLKRILRIIFLLLQRFIISLGVLVIITFCIYAYIHIDKNFRTIHENGGSTNIVVNYIDWASRFTQFNYGENPSTGQSNSEILLNASKKTSVLVFGAMAFSLFTAVMLLFFYYLFKKYTRVSNIIIEIINFISSFHVIVLGIIISLLYVNVKKMEIEGIQQLVGMILILGIGSGNLMELYATLKGNFEKALSQEYIRAAKGRGESVIKHLLSEAVIAIIRVFNSKLAVFISGTIIIEILFTYHGFSYYLFLSLEEKNLDLIMEITSFIGLTILTANFFSDIIHKLLDPRTL